MLYVHRRKYTIYLETVRINYIFSDNVRILHVYPTMSKKAKQLPNWLRRTEASVVLILYNYCTWTRSIWGCTLPHKTSYWSSSSVVIVLLHTALFNSNFEILWKLWNFWNFLKISSFWIFFKSYEIFEILWKFWIFKMKFSIFKKKWNFQIC